MIWEADWRPAHLTGWPAGHGVAGWRRAHQDKFSTPSAVRDRSACVLSSEMGRSRRGNEVGTWRCGVRRRAATVHRENGRFHCETARPPTPRRAHQDKFSTPSAVRDWSVCVLSGETGRSRRENDCATAGGVAAGGFGVKLGGFTVKPPGADGRPPTPRRAGQILHSQRRARLVGVRVERRNGAVATRERGRHVALRGGGRFHRENGRFHRENGRFHRETARRPPARPVAAPT
jgi:hypothetical protein